jgi:hypothetical protein
MQKWVVLQFGFREHNQMPAPKAGGLYKNNRHGQETVLSSTLRPQRFTGSLPRTDIVKEERLREDLNYWGRAVNSYS